MARIAFAIAFASLLAPSHAAEPTNRTRSGGLALEVVQPDEYMREVVFSAAARRANRRKVLVPLFSNAGFGPFLRNVLCSIVRVRVTNWMVVAMDNGTCAQLDSSGIPLNEHACVFPYARKPLTTGGLATYRSLEFNRIVMQRPMWMYLLLQQGYSVLQCDLDVVWLRNPQPLFHRPTTAGADMLFQSEGGYGYNGGFCAPRRPKPARRDCAPRGC